MVFDEITISKIGFVTHVKKNLLVKNLWKFGSILFRNWLMDLVLINNLSDHFLYRPQLLDGELFILADPPHNFCKRSMLAFGKILIVQQIMENSIEKS